jgi:hypothetical protein
VRPLAAAVVAYAVIGVVLSVWMLGRYGRFVQEQFPVSYPPDEPFSPTAGDVLFMAVVCGVLWPFGVPVGLLVMALHRRGIS